MKKIFAIAMVLVLMVVLIPSTVSAAFVTLPDAPKLSGAHYNLNIIGVPNTRDEDWSGGNGSRIFVSRTGNTNFYVYGSATSGYEIKDHNGTDGKVGEPGLGYANAGIVFPYDIGTGRWEVEIYVRLVGPKTSEINWTSSYWDGIQYVEIASFHLDKSSKFSVGTGAMLKDGYQDILWTLDPVTKFRNLQMRIYLHPEY